MKIAITALVLSLGFSFFASAGPIKTGFGEVDISPDIGMERPGGYGKGYHQSFHDPCKARAVVFDDGKKPVALVGLDALVIVKPHVAEVRKRVAEKTDIAPEAILIGASHSHSSGPSGMVQEGEYDHADELVQKLAYEQSSAADPVYIERMIDGITRAIIHAWKTRSDLGVGFGRGEEASASFNRRWKMKNGLAYTHPQYGNPDAIEEAGPIDPEVGVIAAWDEQGKLIGCVVNFACHATTSPRGISANWPWAMEKVIRGTFGDDVVVVFLNGNSGDVTQVDNSSPYKRAGGEPEAMRVGGKVGAEAVKVILGMNPTGRTKEAALDFRQKNLQIPRRKPSPERIAKCRELVKNKPSEAKALNDWIWAKEIVMLDALIQKEPVRSVEVQAIQVGPAVFISNPAEYFCEFGLQQKKGSHFPYTWPVSLANDCVGYVPTTEALGPNGGGYETRLTSYSNLIPEAGDQIRDAGIELANSMKPDTPPEPAPAPKFSAGWSYGETPPELE